jgi:hypothetical protein
MTTQFFSLEGRMFILEDYLVTNSFDAVCEAFRRVRPTQQVPKRK